MRDAIGEVRDHAIDAKGEGALDVGRPIWRIDEDKEIRPVECFDKAVSGFAVAKADMRRSVLHRTGDGGGGKPIK